MHRIELRPPYAIFVGEETRLTYAKTGKGIADWRPEQCACQIRFGAEAVDLGLPDSTVEDLKAQGVGSLVIGTAPVGGRVPPQWINSLCAVARAGIDIVAGLHTRLTSLSELVAAAYEGNARLVDVRVPPPELPVGTGKPRTGRRLLSVGTDCALGKKYTALSLERDLLAAGEKATFRASGQTGIMIAGEGVPIDCVVADFISGAAEILSPENDPDHWDVIEGQGSLFHPGYAAVSHGLLIGSQPDAFVVCHAAERSSIEGWPHMAVPSVGEVIERTRQIGSLTNPNIRCVGISVNTTAIAGEHRAAYLDGLGKRYDLPAVDPLINGTDAIIARL